MKIAGVLPIRPVALGLGALALLAACDRPQRKPRQAGAQPTIKVMTYNVNFGLAGDRETLAAIRAGGADLVLLQETTPGWERAIRKELAAAYPHMAFHHCCRAGGLAVLSRGRILDKEVLPAPSGWFPAWRLVLESPVGELQVLNVHLRPPVSDGGSVVSGYFTTRKVRRAEMATYADRVEPDLPTLVAGDFNEDADGRAVRLLEARGLRSVLPEYRPGADTWRWKTSLGSVSSQLDHIAYDRHLEPLDARVVKAGRSDHFPVVAVFERAR